MILLDSSTKSISVSLAGAVTTNELQCVASYTDVTRKYSGQQGSLNSYVPFTIENSFARTNGTLTNDASLVTLVNPPQASDAVWIYSHEVNSLSIYNSDTASATVTVWLNAAIDRTIVKCTLAVGFTLHYESGEGWYVTNTSGAVVAGASTTVMADGTYGDITVSSSGTIWTLIASINKTITGVWSFVSAKFRLYNSASTFYTSVETVATANNAWTVPNTGSQTFASEAYADAKVTDAIVDAVTTVAPSQNAVFDALALKQPLDANLTTIAGLTPTTDNFIQSKAGAWASRTVAQVYTDLQPSVKGDVYFTFYCLYGGTTPLADSSVWHFLNSGISPTAANTDTNNDFNFGYAVTLIAATIITFGNTTAGTGENVTLALRNTTQATTTTIGNFTTNGGSATVVVNTTINGLNIAIASSDFFTLRVTNPVWVTNPIAAVYRVLLTFKRV